MKLLAKTIHGAEQLLADEIKALGGTQIEILSRAVSFEGDHEVLYKVHIWSRTALRVLMPIHEFVAHNETVLYKRMRRYDWTSLIDLDQTFAISSVVNSYIFKHSKYVALKAKDAIIDQMRDKYDGQRPSIDVQNPDISLDLYCSDKKFVISIDASGDSLHKRGYRQAGRLAPLNEVLAATMVMLSGWQSDQPLYDPMCGSGTILLEALLIARHIPPRLHRTHYQFMQWADYDEELYRSIRREAVLSMTEDAPPIYGLEKNAKQVSETKALIKSLGYDKWIKIEVGDATTAQPPCEPGVMITNPPYGERVGSEDIIDLYKSIGDNLKKNYENWDAWIISGNKDAIKRIGLRTSRKLTLYNGSIECKYHKYEMYRGSKKSKPSANA